APREVRVPRPILSTRRMLVMELIEGEKLVDGLERLGRAAAAREGKTLEELKRESRARIESGTEPGRYAGPGAAAVSAYNAYRRALRSAAALGAGAYNCTIGRLAGRLARVEAPELLVNPPRMVDVLMRAHGRQLLCDGVFNADPHGGNFILQVRRSTPPAIRRRRPAGAAAVERAAAA
ncbi:MAG: hypothetical protein VX563_04505, partial [Planctomycetota bacterium]|nr:hypothetical protein [Planctomycetota bacterium]